MGNHPRHKDVTPSRATHDGRGTPLPQYEKTQSVPFTLTLQEERERPGQFQLVVNIDPQHKAPVEGGQPEPAASKKLVANLTPVPSLGYDVSQLYQTTKAGAPASPVEERQGWSDLDAVPAEFLKKVVPDWKVTFSRSDSSASSQSRKLSDIKARIKRSGKGFVVRLLKGSTADADDVAEVHLGQDAAESVPTQLELDSATRPIELDATAMHRSDSENPDGLPDASNLIHEIGSSNEPGIERSLPARTVPDWLHQMNSLSSAGTSTLEDGLSDADTLIPDVQSIADRLEARTNSDDARTFSSVTPTRSASLLSIVRTPTRGLSVVGPVRRVAKVSSNRSRSKTARPDLNRSGARKSVKRHSPQNSIFQLLPTRAGMVDTPTLSYSRSPKFPIRKRPSNSSEENSDGSDHLLPAVHDHVTSRNQARRGSSAQESNSKRIDEVRLKLKTDIPRAWSANTSPLVMRNRSLRHQRQTTAAPPKVDISKHPRNVSPIRAEKALSEQMREALQKAFAATADTPDEDVIQQMSHQPSEEVNHSRSSRVGEISIPAEVELYSQIRAGQSTTIRFLGLAISALAEKAIDGLQAFRLQFGSDPPVAPNHVRVRWTCTCGESLFDDFVEKRPGAARLLEAYLNRPIAHTPSGPSTRTSTSTSMSSIFDSVSRASTLASPVPTYSGPPTWQNKGRASSFDPSLMRSDNPFSVRIGSRFDEAWLLTCANEGRFTPKIVHVDVNPGRIRCDRDLALALRDHYERLNRRWLKWLRLRGLTTIEFVQFEAHRNRFADIRATPSMPPTSTSDGTGNDEKSPSDHPYSFEPVDLLPPVGSAYLLHLFKHPEDYDGELITYLRAPKRRERLEYGMGWGINLVEGFLAHKVWALVMSCFGLGSAVFAVLWSRQFHDMQGAFGVAGWVVTLAGLLLTGLQAWAE